VKARPEPNQFRSRRHARRLTNVDGTLTMSMVMIVQ
jgi:hypothetical protein